MLWSLSLSSRQTTDEALAKPGLIEPATRDRVMKTQARLDMHIRCERVIADQIALALSMVTHDVEAGCSPRRRYTWTTWVPIDPYQLRWPNRRGSRSAFTEGLRR